ncbi:putative Ig domain-containing protein [Neisseria iguanae]|uniref:Dystroglycan-type cadherin-like domain-containing protein n=1 Tax=Neisseria iguanae TaxID=90242 RepID=A0A2P7U2Q4_9NEIS|nr:putative Ig domain-containing protein [Neisseria iguanae]PSJ81237.1 hypothetical protein C7N83_01440 [Neisseria iguanae]
MINLKEVYVSSLLSSAGYVDGLKELDSLSLSNILNNQLSKRQSEFLEKNFKVITTYGANKQAPGFAAVLWEGKEGSDFAGRVYLSMRGTEFGKDKTDKYDLYADADLALNTLARKQVDEMVKWWVKETADAQGAIPAEYLKNGITVVGHSLGGHLASAFARIFDGYQGLKINGVDTFNSAGFIDRSEAAFKEIEKALGIGSTAFYQGQNNYYTEHGINVTTNDWWFKQVGERQTVFSEESKGLIDGIENHSMYKITDALALAYTLSLLDKNLTLGQFNKILNAASHKPEDSLEKVLDFVRGIVFQKADLAATAIGDVSDDAPSRVQYHRHLAELQEKISEIKESGNQAIQFIAVSLDIANSNTADGMAMRYALHHMQPFALTGLDYSKLNTGQEYSLYSSDNPNGMTANYIAARFEMLKHYEQYATKDLSELNWLENNHLKEIYHYHDLKTDFHARVAAAEPLDPTEKITRFGSDGDESLKGGRLGDKLFGGAGDDVLEGKAGSDYLEGGRGRDVYRIEGIDTVFDSDGSGEIVFSDSLKATRFMRNSAEDKSWYSVDENGKPDNQMTALRPEGSNVLMVKHGRDTAVIKDFFHGDNSRGLGIELVTKEAADQAASGNLVLTGGYGQADKYNIFYAAGSDRHFNLTGGGKADLVFATAAGALTVAVGEGNDRVYGSYGADVIDGGDGNDILNGSGFVSADKPEAEKALDRDIIIGGSGRDLIYGLAGDDIVYSEFKGSHLLEESTGERGDWVVAGEGNDEVYGSQNCDLLTGGEGSDTIFGGAGDDVILGDAFYRYGSRSHYLYIEGSGVTYGYTPIAPIMPFVPGTMMPTISPAARTALTSEYTFKNGAWEAQYINSFSFTHREMDEWEVTIDPQTGDYALTATVPLYDSVHRVSVGGAADFLYGGAGNDLIIGQDGNDYLDGGKGDDILWGDDNRDASVSRDDYLYGGDGDDKLYGGKGHDTLESGVGRDLLDGGEGYDVYIFSSGDLQNPYDVKTIIDEDKSGLILIDGMALDSLNWKLAREGHWVSAQGLSLTMNGSRLLVESDRFSSQIVIEDFSDGMFGLNLFQNNAPEASTQPEALSLKIGETFTYQLADNLFIDDKGIEQYQITRSDGSPLPQSWKFDSATRTLSGMVGEELSGKLDLTITAIDAEGLDTSQNWTIIINENHAPLVQGRLDTAYIKVGQPWEFTIPQGHFTDPDGDKLTYRAVTVDGGELPKWLTFDAERQVLNGIAPNAGNLQINWLQRMPMVNRPPHC